MSHRPCSISSTKVAMTASAVAGAGWYSMSAPRPVSAKTSTHLLPARLYASMAWSYRNTGTPRCLPTLMMMAFILLSQSGRPKAGAGCVANCVRSTRHVGPVRPTFVKFCTCIVNAASFSSKFWNIASGVLSHAGHRSGCTCPSENRYTSHSMDCRVTTRGFSRAPTSAASISVNDANADSSRAPVENGRSKPCVSFITSASKMREASPESPK
mmetsp:Transcript_12286/g.29733  ORF Transcript_12286/g.29733 Transcript_12286/m.29733 type:complete len:213 (-) Transcript_12286:2078-2716(-)